MSVPSLQEIFRKTTTDSQKTLEPSSRGKIPDERFRKLLHALPTDERPREKDLFSLMEEEKNLDGPGSTQTSLHASPLLCQQKKEQIENVDAAMCSPPPVFPQSISEHLSSIAAPISGTLSPEIEAMFEKMASSMIMMCSSGEVETTLFLDNPSSIFFGTKITIREFSTAPKVFNVEITSSVSAINAIESGKNDLLAAFQHGKFNFSIHRFETSIESEDRPVVHRKENSDHSNQEQKGGREE